MKKYTSVRKSLIGKTKSEIADVIAIAKPGFIRQSSHITVQDDLEFAEGLEWLKTIFSLNVEFEQYYVNNRREVFMFINDVLVDSYNKMGITSLISFTENPKYMDNGQQSQITIKTYCDLMRNILLSFGEIQTTKNINKINRTLGMVLEYRNKIINKISVDSIVMDAPAPSLAVLFETVESKKPEKVEPDVVLPKKVVKEKTEPKFSISFETQEQFDRAINALKTIKVDFSVI